MPQRRTTIDAIRGLCLVNIFVNHISNGYASNLSPSRLGFSDSADIFVLLSGISTALAAHRSSRSRTSEIVAHLWGRAARIYAFEVILVLATLGLLSVILAFRGVAGANAPETRLLHEHGTASLLWHALTQSQTVGYSCVLRLHMALMLLAPLLLRLSGWRFWAPLPPAILVWMLAGHFELVATNTLSQTPFALTILPWTLLFTIGIVIGQGLNLGVSLARNRWLIGLALGYLAAYPVLAVGLVRIWPAAHDWAATRNDHFWLGASKTYQSPLRVLHMLALAYVVMALPKAPVIRLLHRVKRGHVLTRLGRRSLPVFTAGAVAAVAASEIMDLAAIPLRDSWAAMLLLETALIALFVDLALRIDWRARRTAASVSQAVDQAAPDARGWSPASAQPGPAIA